MDPVWRIAGTGDADGDGRQDIYWQHTSGSVAIWRMNGVALVEGMALLFFQNQTDGLLAVWLMNGTTLVDGKYLTPASVADQGWRVRGVGDLNGDERPDLLWQHSGSGSLAAWMLDGATLRDGAVFDPPSLSDPRWRVAGPR